ncbi:MAG: tetratricopeptide repeat protein, partial [Candidatus Omnitrophota bacterium]
DFEAIDQALDTAFQHARNYPPEFDSDTQRESVTKELLDAMSRLESRLDNSAEVQPILFRLGKAHTLAFNLDLAGSREKSDKYFAELFKLNPNHAEGHLYYGQHLSGRGEFKSAIDHLQIAADGGFDLALKMIGLVYVQMGDKEKARASFEVFLKKYPGDPQVKLFLDSLNSEGEYELKPMMKKGVIQ